MLPRTFSFFIFFIDFIDGNRLITSLKSLFDKGIILPSGEIGKDKVNLVAGAITQPFAEIEGYTNSTSLSFSAFAWVNYPSIPIGRPIQTLSTTVTIPHKFPLHCNLASRTYIIGGIMECH